MIGSGVGSVAVTVPETSFATGLPLDHRDGRGQVAGNKAS